MIIIKPSYEILSIIDKNIILQTIEIAGRTCYKSEEKITLASSEDFVKRLLKLGHHSVIEHASITIKFICDRGISHEIVRHRLTSISQESTRYANYSKEKFGKEITVIKPLFWEEGSQEYIEWESSMREAESRYMKLISLGAKAEEARSVLPNSLKTEVVMTCNIREWRHILKLRCSKKAHPQVREIMIPLLEDLRNRIPVLLDDIVIE